MCRQSTPLWAPARLSPGTKVWGVAVLVGVLLGSASGRADAAWAMPHRRATWGARPATPPDQSWLNDVPQKPGAHSRGKVAVFVFKGDDVYEPVRAEVVRVLRRRGLNVTAALRPVDSAAQYREMSYALKLAVFVEGEMTGEGPRQSALIRLRSGVTGQPIASAKFSGPTPKIVGAVEHSLWSRLGAATMRACSSASRPRRREREPIHIEAGTPMDNSTSMASEGT
jgi:hypothetical protein